MTAGAMAALQRIRARPPAHAEASRCEFCAQPLAERHEHVLEFSTGALSCSCIACALLFDREGQPLRRVPRDSRYLLGFDLDPLEWASLMIPVKLAFITGKAGAGLGITGPRPGASPSGTRGAAALGPAPSMDIRYPSPGGIVTAPLDADLWISICSRHPELQSLRPGLEALLLNYMERPHQLFITPIDQCYRLAGLVRSAWSGFSGGPEVRRHVHNLCAELRGGASRA